MKQIMTRLAPCSFTFIHNMTRKLKLAMLIAALTVFSFTGSVVLAGSSANGYGFERIVISLTTDPTKDPEPACVALQIGMNLLKDNISGVSVEPANEVTLFLVTGGVELVNPHNKINNSAKQKLVCTTKDGIKAASLQQLLASFETLGGIVRICPLCTTTRGITEPTNGVIETSLYFHEMFMNADKVITF